MHEGPTENRLGLYSSGLDSRLDSGLDLFVFAFVFFSRIDKINVFANIFIFQCNSSK